jgi:RNA polymerase sigma factor (sigma-70 family)
MGYDNYDSGDGMVTVSENAGSVDSVQDVFQPEDGAELSVEDTNVDSDELEDTDSYEALRGKDSNDADYDGLVSSDEVAVRQLYERARWYEKTYCKNHKSYTLPELQELLAAYHSSNKRISDDAADKLVMSVMKLVINIAVKYYPTYYKNHKMDLIMEGQYGVMESLKTYNGSAKFTTWCYRNIIHYMQNYIYSITHNTSTHYGTHMRQMTQFANDKNKRNVPWDEADMMIEANIPLTTIKQCTTIMGRNKNQSSFDDDANFLSETVAAKTQTPEEIVISQEMMQNVHKAIQKALTKQERVVIMLAMGLVDDKQRSDKEIARLTNIPEQYIRKIRNTALYKLKQYMAAHPEFQIEKNNRKRRYLDRDFDIAIPTKLLQQELDSLGDMRASVACADTTCV